MAITPTISRSRQNNFVDARKKEDDIKSLVENGSDGDHITLHAGDFSENNLEVTTPVYVPEDVYVTVLNGATLEAMDPGQPSDPYPLYDIFSGHIENIADLRQTSWDNFEDRAVHAVRSASNLNLNDAKLNSIEIDGPGQAEAFTANVDGNGDVKVGDLEKQKLAYAATDDGKLAAASALNYDGNNFDVGVSTRINDSLQVQDNVTVGAHTKSNTGSFKNLEDNRIPVADTRLGRKGTLVDYKQFNFNGSEFNVGTNSNEVETSFTGAFLLNKISSSYDFHVDPEVGGVFEGVLAVNKKSLDPPKALQVRQATKDVAFYTKTKSSKANAWRVENENEEILSLDGKGLLKVNGLSTKEIKTEAGDDLIIHPSTMEASVRANLTVNYDLKVVGDAMFYDNFLTVNEGVSGLPVRDAGIEVDRGSKNDVDLRWNEDTNRWEFTNDGNVYQQIGTSYSVSFQVVDDTIPSGSSRVLNLSNIFSQGTVTDETILSTFVKDTTPGSPTNGEYINAHGVATVARRSEEYEVYNEHSSSLEFRFVLRDI